MKILGLYFITDSELTKQGIMQDVKDVIEAGCRIVQYRENEKGRREMVEEAAEIASLCREKNVLFIVNNHVDVALAVNADGVHLGWQDMPAAIARKLLGKGKIIGLSTHSVEESIKAEELGVDYISIGPIFHTDTKKDAGKPVGIGLIREVKKAVKLPIVAIGGINGENLQQVLEAGADAVAMISAIVASNNVEETVKMIVGRIDDAVGER